MPYPMPGASPPMGAAAPSAMPSAIPPQSTPMPPPAAGANPPMSGMGSMGGIDRMALARLMAQLSMQNPNANAGFGADPMPPQGSFNPEPTGLGGNPPPY